ncbi:hypothetical protein [Acinetobacter baumannii]|uniref:hypothetical protein n=1 Tax=Acinetobacter baumannii TaxID=470 RepID=UPI00321C1448
MHPFVGKSVVYKYPHRNKICFKFYSAFELAPVLRLATKEEIILGQRIDPELLEENDSELLEDIKLMMENDKDLKLKLGGLYDYLNYYEKKAKELRKKIVAEVNKFYK